MVKVKLRAGKEAVKSAEEFGDFGDPPPPNLYHLKLAGLEKKETQGKKGAFYLNCRWQPVGIGREGAKLEQRLGSVWDTVSLTSEEAEPFRARFAMALGAKPNRAGNVDLDIELDATKPGSPIGTVVLGRVAADKDLNDNYKPKIGWIGPLDAEAETSEEFADDEEEASEAFDEEEEAADDEEVDESELLTEEDLEAMENKELSATAKEFDLVPSDLIVKGRGGKTNTAKTREAIIAAILEAQGALEEEEEGDDEDEPF